MMVRLDPGIHIICSALRAAPLRQFCRAKSRKFAEFQDQAYSAYVVPHFHVLAAENWPTLMDLLGPEN